MKATRKLLATALTACAALIANDVMAQSGRHGAGSDAPSREGAHRGADRNHGSRDGHRHGGHRWRGHGHWRGHWHGYRGWYPSFGFYYGLPLAWGAAWGWPYYYDHWYHPGDRIVYREREVFPEGAIAPIPGPSTEVTRGEGTPTRGPLYMNYCESAKAYFPKVTSCPEGWRLATPSS